MQKLKKRLKSLSKISQQAELFSLFLFQGFENLTCSSI
ncbi:hypothetical protein J504_3254 [Acinetobacter baumannii 348935]|nr:hypothetical protein J504_3254 [Acinetobacter baumannii 348935]